MQNTIFLMYLTQQIKKRPIQYGVFKPAIMYSWDLLIGQARRKGALIINWEPKLHNLKPQHYNYSYYRIAVVVLTFYRGYY